MPVPVRVAVCVVGVALSVTVTVAVRAPTAPGLKVILMTQVEGAVVATGSDEPLVQVVPVAIAKSAALAPEICTALVAAKVSGEVPVFESVSV